MSMPSVEFGNRPLEQLRTTELREELKKRKISTSGLKADLVKRLEEALSKEAAENAKHADSDADDTKDSETPHNYHSENLDSNEESIVDQENENPNDQSSNGQTPSGRDMDIDFNGTENDFKEDQIPNQVKGSSSPMPPGSNSCEGELKAEAGDGSGLGSKGGDAERSDNSLKQVVSENVSTVVGFQVKCESVSTDSVSIVEENELKDSLNVDNNVNFESSEVVVKRRDNLQESSKSNVPQQSSGDDDSESLEQRVQAGGHASVEERGGNNDDEHGICNLDGNNSSIVEQQGGNSSPYVVKDLAQNVQGGVVQNEDKLDLKHDPVEVKVEIKNEDEIPVVKSLREDDSFDAMTIDICSDDKKEVEMIGSDVRASGEKRKKEDQEAGLHEPAKRVRRWNVANNLTVEAVKASTTEREMPTYTSGTASASAVVMRDRPPAMKPILSRSDSTNNGDSPKERIVPPSPKPPTNSLRIERFLRPFTLKAVRELLAETGTVTNFWMDHIKTHCYVTYSSTEEAIATRNALYNLQWPRNGGRQLIAEHVNSEEVKEKVEGPPLATAPAPSPVSAQPHSNSVPLNQMQFKTPGQSVSGPPQHALPPPPSLPLPPPPPLPPAVRERQQPLPPKKVEQPVHTLDDLFKKTRTSPRIYYLPLSEEEVAAKLAARARDRSS